MPGADTLDFDAEWDRRRGDSTKWSRHAADVLPAWVADMDFAPPAPIIDALRARAGVPDLGYADAPPELAEAIVAFVARHHRWSIGPSAVVHLPGLVNGINAV